MPFISLIPIILIALIPIKEWLQWFKENYTKINNKLEKQKEILYISNALFIRIVSLILEFLKGYYIPTVTALWFEIPALTTAITLLTLIGHIWSPFTKFKQNNSWYIVLWGIYTFINPIFALLFPLLLIFFSLLLNTIPLSTCLTIIAMLFIVGLSESPTHFLAIKIGLFIIILLAARIPLFNHLETKSETLLKRFEMR